VLYRQKFDAFLLAVCIASSSGLILSSCASGAAAKQMQTPGWVIDLDAAYPGTHYIAQKGYGKDRQAAESSALTAISGYFLSEVRNVFTSVESYTEVNGAGNSLVTDNSLGEASGSTTVLNETFVRIQASLFAVRYTDPWQDPVTGNLETAAYIDREEAWTIYEPRLRAKTAPFMAVFEAAEKEGDPLRQYYRYSSAREAGLGDIVAAIDFAQILNPQRAADFKEVRVALGEVSFKAEAAKERTSIFIVCSSDTDNLLYTALVSAFSSGGFKVERNEGLASERCEAQINDNKQVLDAGTFFTPSVTVTLSGKTGLLFTYTASAARQGTNNPDIAKRRAYTALASEIRKSFYEEFNTKMMDTK
jgi:hypothetical protein